MEILFICKANVGRSQMAEAFFNRMSKRHHAISAGVNPGSWEGKNLHEFVIGCMAELGYDLSHSLSKSVTPEMVEKADKIIAIMEKSVLPNYIQISQKLLLWDIKDAGGKDYKFHCRIRDEINVFVERLVQRIG